MDHNFTSERAEKDVQHGKLPFWIFDLSLSLQAIALYGYIDMKYGNLPKGIFPKQETLAAALKVSQASVSKYLKELNTAGALTIISRPWPQTNLYRLHWVSPRKD